jgi:peptide/nickel transport system permease protein
MLRYIARRIAVMIPTLIGISIITFIVIQLPPGDFLDSMLAQMRETSDVVDERAIAALAERYGRNDPQYVQYLKWIGGVLRGDFGRSLAWNKPVVELIWGRLGWTVAISLATLLVTWVIAFPIGVYSAIRQYSLGDYVATVFGFIGMATPSFMIALVMMYIAFKYFGISVGGLFSSNMLNEPWSWAKFVDLLKHIWIPMIILALGSTASLIRTMRANLLDELHKPYVLMARARGVPERKMLLKYPVRVALNPFVSTVGWTLPSLVSGSTIVATVLSLPTTGPLLLRALMDQDMFLAGSFILMLSVLTVIGTLVSDILLAVLDPRIRYGGTGV